MIKHEGSRLEALRIVRFSVTGLAATLIHVGVGMAVAVLAKVDQVIASLVGFSVAFIFSFWGHKAFSFQAPGPYRAYLGRFIASAFASLVISTVLVLILSRILELGPALSFAIIGIVVPVFNYLTGRFWTFSVR